MKFPCHAAASNNDLRVAQIFHAANSCNFHISDVHYIDVAGKIDSYLLAVLLIEAGLGPVTRHASLEARVPLRVGTFKLNEVLQIALFIFALMTIQQIVDLFQQANVECARM